MVFIFWSETVLMVIFFGLKMGVRFVRNKEGMALAALVAILPGVLFSGVHLVLSTLMFGVVGTSIDWDSVVFLISSAFVSAHVGIILMVIQYTLFFLEYVRNGAYRTPIPKSGPPEMGAFLWRLMFMQFIIIFGGTISKIFQSSLFGVSLFVILQTLFSLYVSTKKPDFANPFIPKKTATVKP